MSKSKLQREKEELEKKLGQLQEKINEENSRKKATCYKCKKKIQLRRLIYIQTYWYTRPHGCTEGDYWNVGEAKWICPHCRYMNRMLDRDWAGNQGWMSEHSSQFAAEFKKHDYSLGSSLATQECYVVDREELKPFLAKWKELYKEDFVHG